MNGLNRFVDKYVKHSFPYLYVFASFCILDAWLRIVTRWIGAYSIFAVAPNLFTVLWAVIMTVLTTALPSRKAGRIVYAAVYFAFTAYVLVQYGAYLILGELLFVSDFLYAGEGADYISYVVGFLTPALIIQVILLCAIGLVGIWIYPSGKKKFGWRWAALLACAVGIFATPALYGEYYEGGDFAHPGYEYDRFVTPGYSFELTGTYQYVARDIFLQLKRELKDHTAEVETVKAYFAGKTDHQMNDMTGIFAGKNLIVVMMESVDDWLINEKDTPTLYYMMNNGIQFRGMYTPKYSSGYTFNTEFAFNTGVYPYSNGNSAYALSKSTFSKSIASVFGEGGYTANSYHAGYANFYNRGQMHKAFGYRKYHSYHDYPEEDVVSGDDTFLLKSDELFADLIDGNPFYSFVITVSGHLSYTLDEEMARYAVNKYPEYVALEHEELSVIRAKVKMTDDMFRDLLIRLKEEGILEDTVIVGFADHYAYGLKDEELLQQMTKQAGYELYEHTPAFIYCADNQVSIQLDKVMQTTDLAPTIMNLFGFDVPKEIMGHDVFDEHYPGFAIFPNNTWLTNDAYMKAGVLQWNHGMTDEEIVQMNAYVQQAYVINDKILDSDYYAYLNERD